MTAILSAIFLVAGAALCLVAAVGVLRLPDFFMRMHAATKAGVAGCGLLLIGVAFAMPSFAMWVKVAIAILFLLLTTPIAGHLLGRAGYVGGAPLWARTVEDQLSSELKRGNFDRPHDNASNKQARERDISSVLLAIASGEGMDDAIDTAIRFAKSSGADLTALAIIDTKTLHNVGPVPLGGNHYAVQLRNTLTAQARGKVAEIVQSFEQRASQAGVRFRVQMEEGDPVSLLRELLVGRVALIVPRNAWFDQGLASYPINPLVVLRRHRLGTVDVVRDDKTPIIVYG